MYQNFSIVKNPWKFQHFPRHTEPRKKSYWKVHIMKKSFRNSLFWELQQQSKKRSEFRPVFQKIVSRSELTTKRRISPKPVFSSNSQCVKGLFFVQKFKFIKKVNLDFSKYIFWSQKFKYFHENSNISYILDLKLGIKIAQKLKKKNFWTKNSLLT